MFGKPEVIGVSTVLNGTLRATGQIRRTAAGGLGGALGGILGQDVGRSVEKLAGRTLDQRADIRGNVAVIVAAAAHAGLAARAQSHRAGLDRRRQHDHRRRAAQRRPTR